LPFLIPSSSSSSSFSSSPPPPPPYSFFFFFLKLPFWVLIAFGSYSLISIGTSLIFFTDCPDAHASLQKDIKEAKEYMKENNIKID